MHACALSAQKPDRRQFAQMQRPNTSTHSVARRPGVMAARAQQVGRMRRIGVLAGISESVEVARGSGHR